MTVVAIFAVILLWSANYYSAFKYATCHASVVFAFASPRAGRMRKIMGHYCNICGRYRPNEKFTVKGHRNHICKDCAKMPKEEQEAIEHEEEIFNYLQQSNISQKNISRLKKLADSGDSKIAELAGIVLEVAQVKPHKKRRLKILAKERRDLLKKLEETGLIVAHGGF